MNNREFGRPQRLKAALEYCRMTEKQRKEYRDKAWRNSSRKAEAGSIPALVTSAPNAQIT